MPETLLVPGEGAQPPLSLLASYRGLEATPMNNLIKVAICRQPTESTMRAEFNLWQEISSAD